MIIDANGTIVVAKTTQAEQMAEGAEGNAEDPFAAMGKFFRS